MNRIQQLGIASAIALIAVGSQAQTIETDYPIIGGTALAAERAVDTRDLPQVAPLLVQSNAEGPRVVANQDGTAAADEPVRARAQVRFLQAPDVDPV